jgi:hypothetical protein
MTLEERQFDLICPEFVSALLASKTGKTHPKKEAFLQKA